MYGLWNPSDMMLVGVINWLPHSTINMSDPDMMGGPEGTILREIVELLLGVGDTLVKMGS